jgi:hypothetical protein
VASNPFKQKASALRKLTEKAMNEVALSVIKDNEDYAIELNLEQLNAGKDRTGTLLPPYSPDYAERKGRKYPDLKLTGAFWKGWTLNASKFPVEMTSTDDKTEKLVARYGKNIFNLTEVNTRKFAKYVEPIIQKRLRELFQLR